MASVVATMTNKTLANEVRKQIHPNVILPNSDVPLMPEPAASVVSVMDNEEIYVAIVRYCLKSNQEIHDLIYFIISKAD